MSAYCNQCGQYHESLTVCPNWKPITGMDQPRMDPERYNLVGDELRKLTMRVSDLASSLIKMEMDTARHVSMKVDEAFAQVLCNHELQVSLLNEIGLTLTAVAERLKPIERIDTIEGMILDLAQRLYGRLEGIETTLIKEFINAKQSRDSDYALDDRRWEVMHDRVQAIESQLMALAKEQAEQAETLKTYKLSLEGIQGLLVEIQATVPLMLGSVENRIMEQRSQLLDNQTSLATRLAQIEERLRTEMEGMRNIVDALGERLEPCKVCAGKRRVHALFERKALENKAATVDEIMAAHDGRTPRKAGKRPVRKAGKRLKTSKL